MRACPTASNHVTPFQSPDSREFKAALKILEGPTWKVGGYVLVDADTANMIIVADGKERFLVTSERQELMAPTKPCFQLGMEKLKAQVQRSEEPIVMEFTD